MIRHRLLLLTLSIIPVIWCADSILITSIEIKNDVGSIDCASSSIKINNVTNNATTLCEAEYDTTSNLTYITMTLNGTEPVKEGDITFFLTTNVTVTVGNKTETTTEQYSEVFKLDKNPKTNHLLVGELKMPKYIAPTTTAPTTTTTKKSKKRSAGFPKEEKEDETGPVVFDATPISNITSLTFNYIVLHTEETKTEVNKNGGAVAVAIIEGIALICILAYMGYRTMVKHRMKEATMNAALYGYDNNSRNSIRMSDIPPPRDTNYATPPAPTVQQQPVRNTVMTTQELVVPQSSAPATRPTTTTPTTTNGQFNDPFDSLDSW